MTSDLREGCPAHFAVSLKASVNATKARPKMKAEILTLYQCNAFFKTYPQIRLKFNNRGNNIGFQAFSDGCWTPTLRAHKTIESAITAFWQSCIPLWQRPEPVHDGNWALVCIDEYDLSIATYSISERKEFEVFRMEDCLEARTQEHYPTLIRAVEAWIDKYATPEPTAVELLEEILSPKDKGLGVGAMVSIELCGKIRAVIEREKGGPSSQQIQEPASLKVLEEIVEAYDLKWFMVGTYCPVIDRARAIIEQEKVKPENG